LSISLNILVDNITLFWYKVVWVSLESG